MTEPWASVDEVAKHLGVARDSVYRWIEHRGLPATRSVVSGSLSCPRSTGGFAPAAPTFPRKRREAIDERPRDRSRPPAEAPPPGRALRRDGYCEVVEHKGTARSPWCSRASPRVSADTPLRAGALRLRGCRAPLRRGVRAPGIRDALAPSRAHRGRVRHAMGALARSRGRVAAVLPENRDAPGYGHRRGLARFRGGGRTRRKIWPRSSSWPSRGVGA
jgi:excisionase family DNA binding protein